MGQLEDHTTVFIVRIWQERRDDEGAPPLCRGAVELVTTRDRDRYHFTHLDELVTYIASNVRCTDMTTPIRQINSPAPRHMAQMGERLRKWLRK